jgi:hypothetical protein
MTEIVRQWTDDLVITGQPLYTPGYHEENTFSYLMSSFLASDLASQSPVRLGKLW